MKIGQIIKYGLLALGTALYLGCATQSKNTSYVQVIEKQSGCGDNGCATEIVLRTKPKKAMPLNLDNLTECLANNGAKFYGASWCPSCQEQKAMFGSQGSKFYVDCESNDGYKTCEEKGITKLPTWVINGKTVTGKQTIKELSDFAGCNLK